MRDGHTRRLINVLVAVAATALAVFLALTVYVVSWKGNVSVDVKIENFVSAHRTGWLVTTMKATTWLGANVVLIPVVLAAAAWFSLRWRDSRSAAELVATLAGAIILYDIGESGGAPGATASDLPRRVHLLRCVVPFRAYHLGDRDVGNACLPACFARFPSHTQGTRRRSRGPHRRDRGFAHLYRSPLADRCHRRLRTRRGVACGSYGTRSLDETTRKGSDTEVGSSKARLSFTSPRSLFGPEHADLLAPPG